MVGYSGRYAFTDKVEPYRLIETGIVHVPEARRLFVEMSVDEISTWVR